MISLRNSMLILTLLCLALSLSSCGTLAYYQQSVRGQLQLMRASEDIDALVRSADTSVALKKRLQLVLKIRNFASRVLLLPDNQSYRRYADIGRKFIVWNVVATPPLSLAPEQSCFLFVGCLSYRGYFSYEDAVAFAHSLENQGLDVYLGGVSAYSTLGWFDDPVLNGMFDRSDAELARLIFHELAHQLLYIKNDTEFNEAFADSVALIGLGLWLEAFASETEKTEFESNFKREQQFTQLVLAYQFKLGRLYSSEIDDHAKIQKKGKFYDAMRRDYNNLKNDWGGHDEYDAWFEYKLNNAKISAISTYRNLLPLFTSVFESTGKDLKEFYNLIEKISACEAQERRKHLRAASIPHDC